MAKLPPSAGKGRLSRRRRPRWIQVEFVYILHSKKDGKLYIGLTNNISRRIEEHNLGRVSATKGRRPLVLVHLENYIDGKQAAEREKFLKSGQGREFLKDILNI